MQTTIYIRKENEDRWLGVVDKSAWVNSMLAESAPTESIMAQGNEAPHPAVEIFPTEMTGHNDRIHSIRDGKPIIPQPTSVNKDYAEVAADRAIEQVDEAIQVAFKPDNGVCKVHGSPLDSRGRCLTKGCKYA